ncbi:MAG: SixA phosphatase family protein [Rhizomicrobium sp.]
MKRLLLLRHAKAVTGSPKSGDHARPLNDRGRIDAPRMGIALQHKHYLPSLVLCSTARRTVETWQHVIPELDGSPEVRFLDELYLASGKAIINIIRDCGSAADAVLVIGHNPGLEECARALSRKPRSERECECTNALAEKFPTCALAVLDFAVGSWREIASGTGALVDFIRPKDISGG